MNFLLIEPENITNNTTSITDSLHVTHLNKVLKVVAGDTIKIGVLGGNLGTATVEYIDHKRVQLSHILAHTPPPEKLPITLVLALPRPKVLRRIIMDATAMGIQNIYLIHSYRVEKSYWQSPHIQRLHEYMLLGLTQAGDTVFPTLYLKKRFKPFVEDELPKLIHKHNAYVAHPYAHKNLREHHAQSSKEHTVMIIGAEGGFIEYEVDLLTQNGCQPVQINKRILRTETAVSVMVGQLL